jgi:protein O-GlcNAc transferase
MSGQVTLQEQLKSGLSHHQAGRLAEAERIYREVLSRQPDHVDALHLLGVLATQLGRQDEAVELIRRVIGRKPDFADAHANLGVALVNLGQLEKAIAAFQQAVRLKPGVAQMHINLAKALKSNRQIEEAITSFRQAVRINPDDASAHANLAEALNGMGQREEAIAAYRKVVELKPDLAEAHDSLGNALLAVGQSDKAIAAYRQAIRLKADYPYAYYNLANVYKDTGRFDEAIPLYQQAIRLKPDLAEAHGNLGSVLKSIGLFDDAVASLRQAIRLKPEDHTSHSGLLFTLNHLPDGDPEKILAGHQEWSDRHARPVIDRIVTHANDRSPDRRLRIGYVSGDFRRHSVGQFFIPLLENHDRRIVEIFCYANVQLPDEISDQIKGSCDVWRNIFSHDDDAVAEMVRSDAIDILVDLSGHTAGNRLRVFARKPAPIQVTYLGYANTTGMKAVDYRLTDALADPQGMTDHLNVEKLWRLPGCAWCCHPPEDAPDIQPRGSGPITFGCFNAFAKINPKLTAIWAELLKRVPGSRLLLKSAGAGVGSARQRLAHQFAGHGIAVERIEMLGQIADPRRHLGLYQQVDVALDTCPYHGTTTTCEALWMGVPVVTLAGRTHVSRVGVSLLSCVGLPELIAQSAEDYISIATGLSGDLSRLAELRRTLRPRMLASPLMDAAGFARNVEAAYQQMWRNWCAAVGNSGL